MTFIDTVIHGDALEELRKLPDNSLDALVCDPPAGISFMNAAFDSDKGGRKQWIAWLCSIMTEVYRVLRPGAHGLVWSLPRTSHWTATALEDAGFEIRDSIYHLYSKHDKLQAFMASLSDEQRAVFETLMEEDALKLHLFGSGFPKSLAVDKAIDRYFNAEREVIGTRTTYRPNSGPKQAKEWFQDRSSGHITAPATPEAASWAGWGSSLKPSVENWWLIRKPLGESSIAKNVLKWGTGAINIDGSRIPGVDTTTRHNSSSSYMTQSIGEVQPKQETYVTGSTSGRWPSHLLMSHTLLCNDEQCADDCPIAILDAQSGIRKSGGGIKSKGGHSIGMLRGEDAYHFRYDGTHYDPSKGGASRYFAQFRPDPPFIYAPKASRRERSLGCDALPERQMGKNQSSFDGGELLTGSGNKRSNHAQNNHPTVKSLSLMKYLLRLITPPNGIVLDCFAGSGSTLCAAISEGFHYIGIEQEAEYIEIINARITHALNEKNKDVA